MRIVPTQVARVLQNRLRLLTVVNLVLQSAIVVTGGLVRLTGSGLGCPTWPQCVPGSYTPVIEQEEGIHSLIEFGNRLLTFVIGFPTLLIAIAVWTLTRHLGLRLLALVPGVGVVAQAVLGGITVLTGLHPATVAAHFCLSMVLIAASTLLCVRVREPEGATRPLVRVEVRRLTALLSAVGAAVIVVGTVVTGSGPHSGDAETPARFGLDPRTVSWLHADLVLLFVGLLIGTLVALRLVDAPAAARRAGSAVLAVTVAQGGIGYVQYATDLPEALVASHMLGACLLVITLTWLVTTQRERVPDPLGGGAPPATGSTTVPAASAVGAGR